MPRRYPLSVIRRPSSVDRQPSTVFRERGTGQTSVTHLGQYIGNTFGFKGYTFRVFFSAEISAALVTWEVIRPGGSRLVHNRPGPACCENARYGSVTSQQRDGPEKGRLWASRALESKPVEAQGLSFFSPPELVDHMMLELYSS